MTSSSSEAVKIEEVSRVVEEAKELQDAAASLVSKSAKEENALRQQAVSIEASIRRLMGSVESLVREKRIDSKTADKVEDELNRARCVLVDGDASSFLPGKAQGRFLRMFFGPINARASRKDVQLKVKEEYIASGWIYHHYCSMAMALVSLTWETKGQPDCAAKQRGLELFLQWAMMQGVAMLLQNRYQRQRLYTHIALGKANRMDVVGGETAGVVGQLWLLYPILFLLQGFEAYVGVQLLRTAYMGEASEWQAIFFGVLLVIMAVGNFTNTLQTLMAKLRFKAKMNRIVQNQAASAAGASDGKC
ncbi:Transmembrane protein 120B-like protein [Drosera capensis]